jgi:hypothetical protein
VISRTFGFVSRPYVSLLSVFDQTMDSLDQEFNAARAWLRTDLVLREEFEGARPIQLVSIFPCNGDRWTFATLAVFLNERAIEWSIEDATRLYPTARDGSYYTVVCRRGGQMTPAAFKIRLRPHQPKARFKITVKAETRWLFSGNWEMSETFHETKLQRGGLEMQKVKVKPFYSFSFPAPEFENLRLTSRSILRGEPVIALAPSDISKCLRAFVKRCVSMPVPRNCESEFMYTLMESLGPRSWITKPPLTNLYENLHGHLILTVIPHVVGDPFPLYPDSGRSLSVLSGCYVTSYASALFHRNAHLIDGLIMDASWKIIRNSVASILMVYICNVGIPVALALGPKEDKALYEIFYETLHRLYGIQLDRCRVVSDQGTALRSVCAAHHNPQFLCLRHFLRSLGRKLWSEEVGNLIRCRTQGDFDRLCAEYEPRFAHALEDPTSPRPERLLKLLNNIGLWLSSGSIRVVDSAKWGAVSQMQRVAVSLPSTSNAWEVFHGHGKEQTPRRNDFIPGLIRAGRMMLAKALSFETSLEDNFRRSIRLAQRRAESTEQSILDSEILLYATRLDHCECGETGHLAAMYRTVCPCSHQYR